jgi:hypothetical protein
MDLGDDPDGDLDGYDGGYGAVGCTCAPHWQGPAYCKVHRPDVPEWWR